MDGAFRPSTCYEPRPVTFLGVRELTGGWRIKVYSILYGPDPLNADLYEPCLAEAVAALPRPAQSERRPGVGVAIFHQGRGMHYLVLGWWDNENEFPIRLFVRPFSEPRWRPAREPESICVWDLEVLWFERQAYVHHVLGPEQRPDIGAYLAAHLHAPTSSAGHQRP